jgi:hypothetical protein
MAKKGLAVFSGADVIHKLMQDGQVVLGSSVSSSVVTVSGSLTVTGSTTLQGLIVSGAADFKSALTASADKLIIGTNQPYSSSSDLSGVLAQIKLGIASAQSAAEGAGTAALNAYTQSNDARVVALESTASNLAPRVTALETSASNTLSKLDILIGDTGSIANALTTIQALGEYLDGDGNPAVLVADLSTEVNRISGALAQEITDRDNAVSSSITQASNALAAANFSFNGTAISASGGGFRVTGSSNIEVGAVSNGTASVSLKNDVTITGKLSASNVEATLVASTGKMTAGNALEVTTGNFEVLAGNISGSGTLSVGGASTLAGALTVLGTASFSGPLTASAGAKISAGLEVATGDLVVSAGNLGVSGSAAVTGSLTVLGASILSGNLSVASEKTVTVVGLADASGSAVIVNGGSVEVQHGTIKTVLDGTSDSAELSGLWAASGSSEGRFFYLKGTAPANTFPRSDCWYFCQGTEWFDAPFFAG